jgi:Xaa-Pro aminopeptidase
VLLDVNAAMVMEMLGAFESAVAPGVSERELLAVLSDVMIRGGGEYLATNTVCGGQNTNPWRAEATDRRLEPAASPAVSSPRSRRGSPSDTSRNGTSAWSTASAWRKRTRACATPQDRQSNADTAIEEHMALVVELYAGEVGAGHEVKLGDQVVVTRDGVRILCPFPFSESAPAMTTGRAAATIAARTSTSSPCRRISCPDGRR